MDNLNIISFDQFSSTSRFVYKTIGIIPYLKDPDDKIHWKYTLFSIVCFATLTITIILGTIYLVMSMGEKNGIIQVTGTLPCLAFCWNSYTKVITVVRSRSVLTDMMGSLKNIYPTTTEDQQFYRVEQHYKYSNTIFKTFTIFLLIWIWTFNFSALIESYLGYYFPKGVERVFEHAIPYYFWIPFNWKRPFFFEITYAFNVFAGHCGSIPVAASDLFLCTLLVEICMIFDALKRKLVEYEPSVEHHNRKDLHFMINCVKMHNELYDISEKIEDIFGLSILINFSASIMIVCLSGFQILFGESLKNTVIFSLFLFSSTVQIFLLCWFGNQIYESSQAIADGAYQGYWYNGSESYKKALLMIIQRSQRPQTLTALKFYMVSLEMFTKIMSKSFSAFALIKTVYGDN